MKEKIEERVEEKEEVQKPEFVFDLNSLAPIKHIWVDRGLVMSCEGATHPNHRVFKRIKK